MAATVFDVSFSLFVDIAPFTPSSDAVWVFEAIICWIYVIRNLTIINYLTLSNHHITYMYFDVWRDSIKQKLPFVAHLDQPQL